LHRDTAECDDRPKRRAREVEGTRKLRTLIDQARNIAEIPRRIRDSRAYER
jgi:hypothetical protein